MQIQTKERGKTLVVRTNIPWAENLVIGITQWKAAGRTRPQKNARSGRNLLADYAVLQRKLRQLRRCAQTQFGKNPGLVKFNRLRRNIQNGGDFFVGVAFGD